MPDAEQTTLPDLAAITRWFRTNDVLDLVASERVAQYEQWKDQEVPLGTHPDFHFLARYYQTICERKNHDGDVTMADVLLEEVYEALAETDDQKLEDELVQVAAVAVKMVEQIRKNRAASDAG